MTHIKRENEEFMFDLTDEDFDFYYTEQLRYVRQKIKELEFKLTPRTFLKSNFIEAELNDLYKKLIQLQVDKEPLKEQYLIVDKQIKLEREMKEIEDNKNNWEIFFKLKAKEAEYEDML